MGMNLHLVTPSSATITTEVNLLILLAVLVFGLYNIHQHKILLNLSDDKLHMAGNLL